MTSYHKCIFDARYTCGSTQCHGEWCAVYVIREKKKEIEQNEEI